MRLLLILILLTAGACSGSTNKNIGYFIDQKPLKGSGKFNRDYVRPYWQCVEGIRNIKCKDYGAKKN